MVHDTIWSRAGMKDGFLCIGCLEARIGRKLEPSDFKNVYGSDPVSNFAADWSRLILKINIRERLDRCR